MEEFNIKGKIAVVTGGNGQLGTEYVKTLVLSGTKVAIFDVTKILNEELKKLSKKYPIKLFTLDITNKKQIEKALKEIEINWGTPNILVNNAAVDSPPGANPKENQSFENYSIKTWNTVMNVTLTGTFLCCQVIGGKMSEKGGGSIVNICSTYGLVSPNQSIYEYRKAKTAVPFVKPVAYSVSKSGVLNLTRYLATYWAKKNVRVNTLTPGGVFNNQDEEFLKNYNSLVPMGRMAKRNEFNGALLFLVSDASSYMTGSNIVVDGGWTAW